MTPIRTLFLISSIDPAPPEGGKTAGGAERLTRDVCLNIDRSRIEPVLLLHYPPSGVGPELSSAGIEWHVAHRHAHNPFPFWMKLKTLIRREKIRAVVSMNQGPNFDNLAVTPFVRGTGCVISVSGVHMPERIYRTEGKISGREHPNQNTLLVPVGMGSEDIAVAQLAYSRALSRGIGQRFDFGASEILV